MFKTLDLNNWNRKEHFDFFCQMDEPFFGIAAQLDCTLAYQFCKENKLPFFAFYLHKILLVVNDIENFRFRIKDNQVIEYNTINASATVSRTDNTFGFSLIKFEHDFIIFQQNVASEISRIQTTTGLFTRNFDADNLIHFSALPWINFTALSHARSLKWPDSCPKISVGKLTLLENKRQLMPISVHVHHGLMDGYHVGIFLEKLQNLLDSQT
jgi:chloramphenicol O-acetyltransferase type A